MVNFQLLYFTATNEDEQALILAMMEMVVNGVSTRKVSAITEKHCGKLFAKSTVSDLCKVLDPVVSEFRHRKRTSKYPFILVDTLYTKVHENGRVRSKGLLATIGVREDGNREILGFSVADSESKTSWSEIFTSLKNRGLQASILSFQIITAPSSLRCKNNFTMLLCNDANPFFKECSR